MVWTDDQGCFKLNKIFRGRGWMWVHFQSQGRSIIRGDRPGFLNAYEMFFPLRDPCGAIHGPAFNNIDIRYNMYTNQGSVAHVYWGGATVGNALHEFYEYATTDNINTPEANLDIWIGKSSDNGYALMSGQDNLVQAIASGATGLFLWTGPLTPIFSILTAAYATLFIPEVHVGVNFSNSDQLKKLAYHEFAHVSHFTNVNWLYWDNLVEAEFAAFGHGTAQSNNAGLIALAESWADHIGQTYAHRNYGFQNSIDFDWQVRLERMRNEETDHIPIGYYNDLIDTHVDDVNACDRDVVPSQCGPINDGVSGITNEQMFTELVPSVTSPQEFTNNLIEGLPASVQLAINILLASY